MFARITARSDDPRFGPGFAHVYVCVCGEWIDRSKDGWKNGCRGCRRGGRKASTVTANGPAHGTLCTVNPRGMKMQHMGWIRTPVPILPDRKYEVLRLVRTSATQVSHPCFGNSPEDLDLRCPPPYGHLAKRLCISASPLFPHEG